MNQNFSIFLLKSASLNLQKLLHSSSCKLTSHYDTLKLPRNCTTKQIKDSFIKLSKENHPDVNKNPNAHKKFLQIQEAYSILSKPESRASYDLGLSDPGSRYSSSSSSPYQTTYGYGYGPRPGSQYQAPPNWRNPYEDPSFYHNRDRSKDDPNYPYYGIKGIDRVSNIKFAACLVVFATVVFFIQMLVVRRAFKKQHEQAMKRSAETQQILNEIKEQAERNGLQAQTELHWKLYQESQRRREEQFARSK